MTDQEERTRIAADLLQIHAAAVKHRVRSMTPYQRATLTSRIDGVIAWVREYEKTEEEMNDAFPR
jgi:hypothetical protein